MPIAIVNGTRLFWELNGHSGEPIVLVHGSWVDHHMWDKVVPALAQSHRVLTYDRRGHSQSERPAGPYSIRREVEDLAELIEKTRLVPAHIVGTSSGGLIALRLAAERPEMFRSLIVNEPPCLLSDQSDEIAKVVNAQIAEVVTLLAAGRMEQAVRHFVDSIVFGPGAWEQLPLEVRQVAVGNAPTFLDEMRDPEFFAIDSGRLKTFPHPALVMEGERSPPFLRASAHMAAAALPQAERKTFSGAGHEPEDSHPELYVAVVRDYLAVKRTAV